MKYTQLGRTGLRVSRLCLGTMTFGNQCDETTSHGILDHAVESGISFIDTADVYPASGPDEVGDTERIIGNWMRGRRDEVVLASKFGGATGPQRWQRGASRRHIMDAVEGSLKRLQTDSIDLYQIHFPDPLAPADETLQALADLVSQGKVHYIGCSNYPAWMLARCIGRSEVLGIARFDSVQPRYNLLFRQFEADLFPLCAQDEVAVIPYNPLAGGLLTGKHGRDAPEPGSRFTLAGGQGERYLERYWSDELHDTVDAIRPLAKEAGVSMVQLAVSWVLANPAVTSPIVGATRPEQLDDALAAVDTAMDADLKARLDVLTDSFRVSIESR
jgi:aryl-alcohol dehydrogenase-like predicted oxidoreductase